MTKREVERRSRRWTRRSEKPVRYGLVARVADWWCATRDARRGLPDLPADDRAMPDVEIPTGTPHMSYLGQQALGRIEKEWIVYQAEVADPMADLRDLEAEAQALHKELIEAKDRFDHLGASPAGVEKRAGEAETDAQIVAMRRAREHGRKRDQAQADIHRLTTEINQNEARAAQVREQIEIRHRIATRRAALIEAHIRRRRAAYEKRLVRKHPQGRLLNRLLRPDWPAAPEWTSAESGVTKRPEYARQNGGDRA